MENNHVPTLSFLLESGIEVVVLKGSVNRSLIVRYLLPVCICIRLIVERLRINRHQMPDNKFITLLLQPFHAGQTIVEVAFLHHRAGGKR